MGKKGYNMPLLGRDILMRNAKHTVLQKDSEMYLCHDIRLSNRTKIHHGALTKHRRCSSFSQKVYAKLPVLLHSQESVH